MAVIATISFSYLFNVPHREMILIGLTGGLGWFIYLITLQIWSSAVLSTFIAALAVTWVLRILTHFRKTPMTVFLLGGIISLVPGTGIYNTMFALILEERLAAFEIGVETARIFGVICIGIILVLSLPKNFFFRI
jgi:uncharacterized membrane protein YjjB (DUF3815 family)